MKQKFLAKSVSVAQATDRILQTAERIGMVLPSSHTALFQSIYSPIEEANGNGIRLAKDAVDAALPGIIGAQANLEHLGRNWMVGMILDAWVNDSNEIEIIYSFAKNIYEEEYVRALEQMQNGQLAVSFELLSSTEAQESLTDGTLRLNDFAFTGVGVLIEETPAYDKAITYEFANIHRDRAKKHEKELMFASQIVKTCDDVLAQDAPEEPQELLWTTITTRDDMHIHVTKIDMDGNGETVGTFGDDEKQHTHKIVNYQIQEKNDHAHRLIEELLAKRKDDLNKDMKSKQVTEDKSQTKQGGTQTMNDEQKKLVADLREEFGEFAKDISDEQLLDEAKVEEIRKAKADAEAEAESEDTNDSDANAENTEAEPTDLEKAEARIAELEAENAELKATIEAKASEIESVRENAEKIGKLKVELKDNTYVAEFSDEDYLDDAKIESAKIRKENDDLKAANEELSKKAEEANTEKEKLQASKAKDEKEDLNTGHDEVEEDNDVHSILKKKYVK